MPKNVVWKIVPGFPEYDVSEYGDVRKGERLLKAERVQGNDRKRLALSKGGRTFRFKAHHLVALAFLGPKPFDGAEVCHNDGFMHNNHYSNLRWDTHAGNTADAVKHRLRMREGLGRALTKHRIDAAASAFLAQAGSVSPE